jgi:hypothetical protein
MVPRRSQLRSQAENLGGRGGFRTCDLSRLKQRGASALLTGRSFMRRCRDLRTKIRAHSAGFRGSFGTQGAPRGKTRTRHRRDPDANGGHDQSADHGRGDRGPGGCLRPGDFRPGNRGRRPPLGAAVVVAGVAVVKRQPARTSESVPLHRDREGVLLSGREPPANRATRLRAPGAAQRRYAVERPASCGPRWREMLGATRSAGGQAGGVQRSMRRSCAAI